MKAEYTRREFLGFTAAAIVTPLFPPQASRTRIATLAGTGVQGLAVNGDLADHATLNNPFGVVIGPDGSLHWVDYGSHLLLRLDLRSKKISVIAGTGTKGYSGDGGPASAAQLNTPHELRFDSKGNIYIAERDSHVVRFIDMKAKTISTLAGNGTPGFSGDGGPANKSQLARPHSIALDRADNVYICDIMNHRVRKIDAKTEVITTFAGTGELADTPAEASLDGTPLSGPRSIDITPDGQMYLVLREGNRVFAIDVEHCPYGGGDLKIIAAIEEPAVIARILTHLDLPIRRRSAHRRVRWLCSGRPDPQGKNGSATGPTIRLGPHSHKQSNCVEIKQRRVR